MGWQVQPPPTSLAVIQGLTVPTTVVQAATPAAGTSPVSVSLAHPVTAGNSVVLAFIVSTATGPAISGGTDTYTTDATIATSGTIHQYYAHVSRSAGGYSTVTVTAAAATIFLYAYEVLGTTTFDASANAVGTASFSTNITPATSAEFLAGLAQDTGLTPTLTTPPAAPWVNQATLSSGGAASTSGYQFVSSVAAVTYSGTWSASPSWASIGAYKLTNPGATAPTNGCILYYFGGQLFALGTSGVPVVLATT